MPNKKTLTLVEGRKVNYRTINDMKTQTAEAGWGYRVLEEIPKEDVAKCNFREYFSDYVMWRDLNDNNSPAEVMRILKWIDLNKDIISINTHLVGGRAFSSDKYYQHGLYGMDPVLKKNTPMVYPVKNVNEVIDLVKKGLLNYPLVLKERLGTTGKGIVLVPDEDYLRNHVKGVWRMIMAEPYIVGDYDWRVFVVGGVAVGAMRKFVDKIDDPGNFVAKSAGKDKVAEDDPEILAEISKIACKMAAVCGLEYSGCDIIRDKYTKKYYVLETNNSAGWQNRFNDITGLNMGQILLSWFDDMSVLKEKGFYEGVKTYFENRTKYLSKENRDRCEKILNWKEKPKQLKDDNMVACLQNKYLAIVNGENVKSAKDLLKIVESTPLCWAGNFIGSNVHGEDGVFEDGCIPTAYYLAIREKYDKIAGVN